MPRYEFLCEKCQKPFELTMTISEREGESPVPDVQEQGRGAAQRLHGADEEEELTLAEATPSSNGSRDASAARGGR
jgi:hypothetical protein